jgi:uncharacterized protein (TIRG00374 family)
METRWVYRTILVIMLGAGGYAFALLVADGPAKMEMLRALELTTWAFVLTLSVTNYTLRSIRWEYLLRKLDANVGIKIDALGYVAGFAMNLTPGKVGELGRCVLLRPLGVNYDCSVTASIYERAVDLLIIVLLATPVIALRPDFTVGVAVILTLILVTMATIWAAPAARAAVIAWALQFEKILALSNSAQDWLRVVRRLRGTKVTLLSASLGLLAWGLEGWGLFIILNALDVSLRLDLVIYIYASAVLVGALSALPGGLGTTEAAMIGLLMVAGVDAAVATTATIICRVATLWFAIPFGVFATVILVRLGQTRGESIH